MQTQANSTSMTISDDSSLVPASLDDELSYVIPSPPASLNTIATTRSMDDLVLVDAHDKSSRK